MAFPLEFWRPEGQFDLYNSDFAKLKVKAAKRAKRPGVMPEEAQETPWEPVSKVALLLEFWRPEGQLEL